MKWGPAEYATILYEEMDAASVEEIPTRLEFFIKLLRRNRAIGMAPRIMQSFQKIWNERKGIVPVTVRSAVALSDELRKKLLKAIPAAGKIELIEEVNSSLIGGIELQTGDTVIDATMRVQFEKLRRVLSQT